MDIQIININNLQYTKNLIDDLFKQTAEFHLTLVDQGSNEKGTNKYLDHLKKNTNIKIIKNPKNVNINKLWNNFYHKSKQDYLCFLNNDIKIPSNFIKDTIQILNKEKQVGCVVHSTNHPDYNKMTALNYIIPENQFVQGWDFTIRKNAYKLIPEQLDTFGGDDWLFSNLYKNNWKIAMVLSSPIIHYWAKSRKYYIGDRKITTQEYQKYGFKKLPYYLKNYCQRKPTFLEIKKC